VRCGVPQWRRRLFPSREGGGFGGAFDDDLLGLRIMLGEPVAAVVERRAVGINFGDGRGVPARHEGELDAHDERFADEERGSGFGLGQAHELVGGVGDDAAGGVLDGDEDVGEFAGLKTREGFLDGRAFRKAGAGKAAQRHDVGEASRTTEVAEAQGRIRGGHGAGFKHAVGRLGSASWGGTITGGPGHPKESHLPR